MNIPIKSSVATPMLALADPQPAIDVARAR